MCHGSSCQTEKEKNPWPFKFRQMTFFFFLIIFQLLALSGSRLNCNSLDYTKYLKNTSML